MSFLKELAESCIPLWEQSLEKPFLREMALGTLAPELFRQYTIDDSIYLREYARVIAYAIYKSENMSQMQQLYRFLNFINATETVTRVRYLHLWGMDQDMVDRMQPREENLSYTSYMLRVAKEGELPEILMAILPCMLSYTYIGLKLVERYPDIRQSPYWEVIEEYISPFCLDCCQQWGSFAQQLCEDLEESRKEALREIFRCSCRHEQAFWDMAYRPCDAQDRGAPIQKLIP